jgi:hypothetical protein
VQAVVVPVCHVAERNIVEREPELALIEAAYGKTRGPLVSAKRIGGLEIHARKFCDRFERARSRGFKGEVAARNGLRLASFADADDENLFDFVRYELHGTAFAGDRL